MRVIYFFFLSSSLFLWLYVHIFSFHSTRKLFSVDKETEFTVPHCWQTCRLLEQRTLASLYVLPYRQRIYKSWIVTILSYKLFIYQKFRFTTFWNGQKNWTTNDLLQFIGSFITNYQSVVYSRSQLPLYTASTVSVPLETAVSLWTTQKASIDIFAYVPQILINTLFIRL